MLFSALSAYQRFFNAQQVNYWKVSLIIDNFINYTARVHTIVSPMIQSHIAYPTPSWLASFVHFSLKRD